MCSEIQTRNERGQLTWEQEGLTLTELCAQPYGGNNCKFSTGTVKGHPVDSVYLRLEKEGVEPLTLLLRPDEMAAIAYCAGGVLWSHLEAQDAITDRDAEILRLRSELEQCQGRLEGARIAADVLRKM